jgi:hypothetical protein
MFITLFLLYLYIIKHEIKTTSETPISLRPYRIPYARRDEVEKLLDQMLKDEHIVPSKSLWSSPIVVIDKNDKCIAEYYKIIKYVTTFCKSPTTLSINLANVEGDVFMPNGITVNSYCPNGVINAAK